MIFDNIERSHARYYLTIHTLMHFMPSFLIVENYPPLVKYFERLIRKRYEGALIYSATDGFDALEKARTLRCSVILSEIALPIMNGIEFYKRLAEESPLLATRLGFMSSSDAGEQINYLKARDIPCFIKPVGQEDFYRLVDEILMSSEGSHCGSISCRIEREGRRRLAADCRLTPVNGRSGAPIEGEITDISGGGFGFLYKGEAFPHLSRVSVSSDAIDLREREAEIVWCRSGGNDIRFGFQWRHDDRQ